MQFNFESQKSKILKVIIINYGKCDFKTKLWNMRLNKIKKIFYNHLSYTYI
jgi:hypothetical protein